MGIRQYKPTSPGRRDASVSDFADLTPGAEPEKSLLRPLRRKGGRNNQGVITRDIAVVVTSERIELSTFTGLKTV